MDLSRGPISTFALIRLAPDRHLFYCRLHHAVIDGYSIHLIERRIAELYSAAAGGQLPSPGFAPLSTLVDEDVDYRSGPQFARDREYWTDRFRDEPAATRLPGGDAHSGDPRPPRFAATEPLHREELDRIGHAAAQVGATWQIFLLAAVAAYTRRVANDDQDVIIGMPVAGRRSAASRRAPGMATNSVALRIAVDPGQSLARVVATVAEEVRAALRHDRYRAEDLRRDLGLDGSGRAFIGPMVNFMPREESLRFGDSPATTHNLASGPIVDLSISVVGQPTADQLALVFEANSDHHDLPGFQAHRERFSAFLAAVTAAPQVPIDQVDLLLPAERVELLDRRNATARPVPATTVAQAIEQQARRTPDAVALAHEGRTWTYAQLDGWAGQVAADLAGRGLGAEDLVAVQLPRSPQLVVAMLAVLRAGAAYAPVDPTYPADRIRTILDDLSPRHVITTVRPPAELTAAAAPSRPADPASPAYVIYTSGSTGTPKGVMVTHRAVHNFALDHARRFGVDADSRVLQYVSPSFDVAAGDIWPTLLRGGRVVLAPEGRTTDAAALVALLAAERITHAAIPPAMLAQLPAAELPDLRLLITGGERPETEVIRRWSTGRRMVNVYGVTEATVASTTAVLSADLPPAIGRPIDNCQAYLLDSRLGPLPARSTGELYLAGSGLARGYLRRPELTAARFLPCPFGAPGSRMYATGDQARWRADGELEFRHRTDDQVKIRGFRVELGEVSAVLSAHPQVRAAVAVAARTRSGHRRLTAYVCLVPGATVTAAQLRDVAARALPDFMVPAVVVPVDTIPMTPHGKVDRDALAAATPAASTAGPAGDDDCAPAGSREATLCALFAEALGVDRVGTHDSFFDLGGNSIMVFPLVARAREAGLELSAREVFRYPTVAALAPVVRGATPAPVPAPGPGAAARLSGDELDQLRQRYPTMVDVLRLSPLQEGFVFHNALAGAAGDAYASQIQLDLDGPLDTRALRSAGETLLRRHPNLRAAFVHADLAQPVQVIPAEVTLPWAEGDLSGHGEEQRDAEARRLAAGERDRGWDLGVPPLLRLLVLKLSAERHRVILTGHHILWDGWSTSILVRELFTLYEGQQPPAVLPYTRYLDWLAARDRATSRAAWSAALTELAQPTLVAPAAGVAGRQRQVRCDLGVELTERLVARARSTGLTVNTLVQGTWALVLSQLTGLDDVVFGSSVSGRPAELPGIETAVGLLTNTIPVRVRLRAGEPLLVTLTRLQAEQADLIAHHHLGLSEVQRQCDTGPTLFDTAIMFVNYSFDPAEWTSQLANLKLVAFEVEDDTHYPLRLAVVSGPQLHLRLGYSPEAFRPPEAERLLARVVSTFESIAAGTPR
ncbi:Amino acid adenylation domain-containing protein [Frankia sp. AgKG'84/4]